MWNFSKAGYFFNSNIHSLEGSTTINMMTMDQVLRTCGRVIHNLYLENKNLVLGRDLHISTYITLGKYI